MSNALTDLAGIDAVADAYPTPSLRKLALASVATVVLGLGGLIVWAAMTPLDSAVPASGAFVAAGKRKTISILDPGTLKTLLVKEGDVVTAGQPLFVLDDVQMRVALKQTEAQYWGAIARAVRLKAEIADERALEMPDALLAAAAADPAIAAIVRAEA